MDLRRKAQRWVSVICCTVLFLSAVQLPTRRDAASAQSPPGEGAGQTLAYIGSDNNLWLMNADGSGRTALTQDGLVSRFAWAPDGRSVAIVSRPYSPTGSGRATDVLLLNLASNTETLLLDDLDAGVWSVAWTPDGTRLAFLTYNWPDGTARVIEANARTGVTTVLDSWQPVGMGVGFPFITSGVAWSPDGRSLLVYGYPSRTEVLTVDAGAVTQQVFLAGSNSTGSMQEHGCLCPRWSPDGSLIVCHEFETLLVVTPEGELVHEFPVSERSWQSPAWSPDGTRIATGGRGGLSVIDLRTGGVSQLVTREAWEPSWSPDEQYLAFSLVDGLGSERHELQGIGVIGVDGQGLQVYDVGSRLALWQPVQAPLKPACGTWDGSVSDERIELTRVSESPGDECRGAFTFSNKTVWWGDWGAYALELEVRRMNNANAVWVTLLAPTESIESTFLLPTLDRELHTFPLDRYSAAQVTVSGEMTLASITVDLALQALGTAVDLIPGGSCLIPEEQLAYAAASFAYILAPAARLIWEGDLDGALEELQQLLPQFLERCGDALTEVVSDCVAEGLTKLLGKPVIIAKLAGECIIWSVKAIWDYFDYQGRPVYATVVYESPTQEPLASRDVVWSEARRIDEGSSGAAYQLLPGRDGRMWAFWEEHLPGGTPEHLYDAVHYRIWDEGRWGSIQDIPGSENMGEQSAVLLPDGSILVKADDLNEQVRKWFLWDGSEWSAVPDMSLTLSQEESGQSLGIDGQGKVHLLGVPARIWDGTSWRETGSLSTGVFHSGAIDTEGNLHVAAQRYSSGETGGIEHWAWDGDSWSTPELAYAFPEESPMFAAPPALAIDPDGAFHLVWGGRFWQPPQPPTQPSLHWLTYHRGDGNLWSQPQTLFGPVTMEGGSWWADVDVWSDGLVVAAWGDVKTELGEAVYAIWGNEGNWTEPVMLSPDDGHDYREPDVEIDATGLVHVLWSSPSGGIYHVVGSRSDLLP